MTPTSAGFGAFCANYPARPNQYITSDGLAVVAKITMNLLSPVLVFVTLAEGISLDVMKDVGVSTNPDVFHKAGCARRCSDCTILFAVRHETSRAHSCIFVSRRSIYIYHG